MENLSAVGTIDIQEALKAATREKTKLRKELKKIDQEIASYKGALRLAEKRLSAVSVATVPPQFQGMSRPQACAILMRQMGGEASIKELSARLSAIGLLLTNSGEAWYKVRNALDQRPDLFVKIGPGRYALVELKGQGELPLEEPSVNGRPPTGVKGEIFQILKEEGRPLHYSPLLTKLQQRGILIGGKDPRNTLLAHLSQDHHFKNVSPGVWGLAAWQDNQAFTQPSEQDVQKRYILAESGWEEVE